MSLAILLTFAYLMSVLLFLYKGTLINHFYFVLMNSCYVGMVVCGLKIVQDLTNCIGKVKIEDAILMSLVGIIFSNIGYVAHNTILFYIFYSSYIFACMIPFLDGFMILWEATNQKKIGKSFIITFTSLAIIFTIQILPTFKINPEFSNYIFKLRVIENVLLPLAIALFISLVFSKYFKDFYQKQEEIDSLTLEKQAILETQNENLAVQVALQTSELKAINDTKDRLFSIIGHDLRSPIASLKGILLLIDNQQLSREEFDELLQHLQKNVDNVHGMLENLLQWSLSQMKEMKPSLKAFEINDVVEQTVELFKEVAKQKKIDLQTDLNENLIVFADENHIRAVIRNLLNNALKFTPENGRVSIKGNFKNNFVELQITDTGIGINTDEMQLIFSNPKLKR